MPKSNNALLSETEKLLSRLVGKESSDEIMSSMFPEKIKGYKKGDVITVKEIKSLEDGSVIHLHYLDEDGSLMNNGFLRINKYDGNPEMSTTDGFTIPIDGLSDDDKLSKIDNCGWTFTVSKAIKQKK